MPTVHLLDPNCETCCPPRLCHGLDWQNWPARLKVTPTLIPGEDPFLYDPYASGQPARSSQFVAGSIFGVCIGSQRECRYNWFSPAWVEFPGPCDPIVTPRDYVDCMEQLGGMLELARLGADIDDHGVFDAGTWLWLSGMEIILNGKLTIQIHYQILDWVQEAEGYDYGVSGRYIMTHNCVDAASGGPFTTLAAMAAAAPSTIYGTYINATIEWPGSSGDASLYQIEIEDGDVYP